MKRLLMGLVCLGCLSGCAVTTEQITLSYQPQDNIAAVAGADKVGVDVTVKDERPDMSRVSRKKNGFGMEMASITAVEDVTVTIRKALEEELRQRGFLVGSSQAMVSVETEVTRFYNDFKLGVFAGDSVADLNMLVKVHDKDGKPLFSRQLMTQGFEKNIQLMTGDNARLALNDALKNGMFELFSDDRFVAALLSAAK